MWWIINELLQSVNNLSIEPPNLETIEKLGNMLVLGETWRVSVSHVLSGTMSRLESFRMKSSLSSSSITVHRCSSQVRSRSVLDYVQCRGAVQVHGNKSVSLIDRVTGKGEGRNKKRSLLATLRSACLGCTESTIESFE